MTCVGLAVSQAPPLEGDGFLTSFSSIFRNSSSLDSKTNSKGSPAKVRGSERRFHASAFPLRERNSSSGVASPRLICQTRSGTGHALPRIRALDDSRDDCHQARLPARPGTFPVLSIPGTRGHGIGWIKKGCQERRKGSLPLLFACPGNGTGLLPVGIGAHLAQAKLPCRERGFVELPLGLQVAAAVRAETLASWEVCLPRLFWCQFTSRFPELEHRFQS